MRLRSPLHDVFDEDLEPKWRATRSRGLSTKAPVFGRMRGGYVRAVPSVSQRVVTQISRCERKRSDPQGKRNFGANLKATVRYIQRDQAIDEKVFDRNGAVEDAADRTSAWLDDQRYYRLVISPEHGARMPDMALYTREVMEEIERKLVTADELAARIKLDWIAAVHTNTAHPHSHVLIRGQVGRDELCMPRCFETRGIASLAREVASRSHHLGARSWSEIVAEREAAASKDVHRDLERKAARKGWSFERD